MWMRGERGEERGGEGEKVGGERRREERRERMWVLSEPPLSEVELKSS